MGKVSNSDRKVIAARGWERRRSGRKRDLSERI
jgi:hypothetical protein